MTIKKLGLSVVASAVLATSSFALDGTMSYAGSSVAGDFVISNEYIDVASANTGTYQLDLNDTLVFSTNFQTVGSGTVSDPAFVYTFSQDVEANFTGATGTVAVVDNASGLIVAILTDISANGDVITFEGDSNANAFNLKDYAIVDVATVVGGGVIVPGAVVATTNPFTNTIDFTSTVADEEIKVELYSTSGTEVLRDTASIKPFSTGDQITVACDTRLDGMINFENSSLSFVPTGHGIDQIHTGAIAPTDGSSNATTFGTLAGIDGISDVNSDAFIFNVTNTTAGFDLFVDGVNTRITLAAANLDDIDGAVSGTLVRVDNGVVEDNTIINGPDTITYEITNGLPVGTTTYVGTITSNLTAALPATTFKATVTAADNSNLGSVVASNVDAGEWMDYTYIAQIPGASNYSGITDTRLFITNRSCDTAVAPTFRLIKDGVVTEFTSATTIAKDTQVVFKLADLIAEANAGLVDGQYAIEVILPGIAEDFYIYASNRNLSGGNFKDLPVYSTSTRN